MGLYNHETAGGVKLTPLSEMKKIGNKELCYICGQEAGKNSINTHGIVVCPDCVKRIVRNYVADKIKKESDKNEYDSSD